MSFNSDLYKKIQSGGLALSSPSIDLAAQSTAQLGALTGALSNPKLIELGVSSGFISSTIASIESSAVAANASVAHMTQTANNSLEMSSQTMGVNKLDAMADGIAQGCDNTMNLFASIQGDSDAFFNDIESQTNALMNSINDLLAGRINLSAFESAINSCLSEVATAVASVDNLIAKEKAHYGEVLNKMKSLSAAQAIDRLWQNDCTKALMETVLPDDIKGLL